MLRGGAGYWNKVRLTHPEIFNEMALVERQVKATCLKKDGKKFYLDQLDPKAGRHEDISLPDCGVVCQVEMDGLGTVPIEKSKLVESMLFA